MQPIAKNILLDMVVLFTLIEKKIPQTIWTFKTS
jgi:hypothetical protein